MVHGIRFKYDRTGFIDRSDGAKGGFKKFIFFNFVQIYLEDQYIFFMFFVCFRINQMLLPQFDRLRNSFVFLSRWPKFVDKLFLISFCTSKLGSEADFVYKIVLVGDATVGKTHLLSRYIKGSLPKSPTATIGRYRLAPCAKSDLANVLMWKRHWQQRFKFFWLARSGKSGNMANDLAPSGSKYDPRPAELCLVLGTARFRGAKMDKWLWHLSGTSCGYRRLACRVF